MGVEDVLVRTDGPDRDKVDVWDRLADSSGSVSAVAVGLEGSPQAPAEPQSLFIPENELLVEACWDRLGGQEVELWRACARAPFHRPRAVPLLPLALP